MRIHRENTEGYLHALASSIRKDPASLEGWYCLHLETDKSTDGNHVAAALEALKASHGHIDCDAVHCTDHDVLLISRTLQDEPLHEMADTLAGNLMKTASTDEQVWKNMALYDLFRDWRCAGALLTAKMTAKAPVATPRMSQSQINLDALTLFHDTFDEAKKLRQTRSPSLVMLVEDDPVTRRIVTCGFKESYALITAGDAQEAVTNYLLFAPDIVFLDIGLPDTSGFEVLQQVMDIDPDAYVVMFSGNSYLDNVTAALESGASGFVAKPFKKQKMQCYIEDSVMHHRKYGM